MVTEPRTPEGAAAITQVATADKVAGKVPAPFILLACSPTADWAATCTCRGYGSPLSHVCHNACCSVPGVTLIALPY
jgi:hypothetical protein